MSGLDDAEALLAAEWGESDVVYRRMLGIVLVLVSSGCADSVRETAQPEAKQGDGGVATPVPEQRSRRVGPVSFVPPRDWEIRQATQTKGLVLFAPERPEWKEMGFRANLAVRRRPHPGVSLDRHRDKLDRELAKSVEQVNRTLAQYLKEVGDGRPSSIPLREKGEYSLMVQKKNGVRVLMSTFSGVYELRKVLVPTKTYGMQFMDSDALYSISLTFPSKFEPEMDAVWKSFQESVRIAR